MPFSCFCYPRKIPTYSWVKGKGRHTLSRLEEDRPSGGLNESRFHKWRLKLNPCPASRKSSSPSATYYWTVQSVSSLPSFIFVVLLLYGSRAIQPEWVLSSNHVWRRPSGGYCVRNNKTACVFLLLGARGRRRTDQYRGLRGATLKQGSSSWKEEKEARELVFFVPVYAKLCLAGIGDRLLLSRPLSFVGKVQLLLTQGVRMCRMCRIFHFSIWISFEGFDIFCNGNNLTRYFFMVCALLKVLLFNSTSKFLNIFLWPKLTYFWLHVFVSFVLCRCR